MEAAISMGASVKEIIFKFLYVEARSGLVLGLTTSIISFISYSTIMGVVGGGGIGDFAIRYGYQVTASDKIRLADRIAIGNSSVCKKLEK